jgi:hypothetical protein
MNLRWRKKPDEPYVVPRDGITRDRSPISIDANLDRLVAAYTTSMLEARARETGMRDGSLGVRGVKDAPPPFVEELAHLGTAALEGLSRVRSELLGDSRMTIAQHHARISPRGGAEASTDNRSVTSDAVGQEPTVGAEVIQRGRLSDETQQQIREARKAKSDEAARVREREMQAVVAESRVGLAVAIEQLRMRDHATRDAARDIQAHFFAAAKLYWSSYYSARATVSQRKKEVLRDNRWFRRRWPIGWFLRRIVPKDIGPFVGEDLVDEDANPAAAISELKLPSWVTGTEATDELLDITGFDVATKSSTPSLDRLVPKEQISPKENEMAMVRAGIQNS